MIMAMMKVKISDPLTVPYAVSHFSDEHMLSRPIEIHNQSIAGFTVEADLFMDDIRILDLYHDSEYISISSENNYMEKNQWLRSLLDIPENMETVKRAIVRQDQEQRVSKISSRFLF